MRTFTSFPMLLSSVVVVLLEVMQTLGWVCFLGIFFPESLELSSEPSMKNSSEMALLIRPNNASPRSLSLVGSEDSGRFAARTASGGTDSALGLGNSEEEFGFRLRKWSRSRLSPEGKPLLDRSRSSQLGPDLVAGTEQSIAELDGSDWLDEHKFDLGLNCGRRWREIWWVLFS